MLSGTFERKLRQLNKDVRIFCGDDGNLAAGIFIVTPSGEYTEICGVDKNYLTEWTIYGKDGRIIKAGWRRTLKILINKKLINKAKAEKLFSANLSYPINQFVQENLQAKRRQKLKSLGLEIIEQGGF